MRREMYAAPLFQPGRRVPEIGPDKFPAALQDVGLVMGPVAYRSAWWVRGDGQPGELALSCRVDRLLGWIGCQQERACDLIAVAHRPV